MIIRKGSEVERNKFEIAVARKKAVQIYSRPCVECPFALPPESKVGFHACVNPYVIYKSIAKNYGKIISCADARDYNKCEFVTKAENKLLNDFIRVKKYIKHTKLVKGVWLHLNRETADVLLSKLKVHNAVYLEALFLYFGYIMIHDENVDGFLFTNDSNQIKENFSFVR